MVVVGHWEFVLCSTLAGIGFWHPGIVVASAAYPGGLDFLDTKTRVGPMATIVKRVQEETSQRLAKEFAQQPVAIERLILQAGVTTQELAKINVNIFRCFCDTASRIEELAYEIRTLSEAIAVNSYGQQQLDQLAVELKTLQETAGRL